MSLPLDISDDFVDGKRGKAINCNTPQEGALKEKTATIKEGYP